MSPDRFVPIKVAEYGYPDLQEARQLLDTIPPRVNMEAKIGIAISAIDQMPNKTEDSGFEELARRSLTMQLLAYNFWYIHCVVDRRILRGNISVWQKTPDSDLKKLSFEATFSRRNQR